MQVTETLNEGLKRGYDITVTAAELDAKVNEKLEEARADFQMQGFRKGKVPIAMMKKRFGKSVLGEAMQDAIDAAMQGHFEATGDRPAAQPDVKMTNDEWKEGDDVQVSMTYEALPEIPETDFTVLKVEKLVTEIEDAAVQEALDNLANSTSNYKKRRKGSKAKTDDQIVIDFVGKVDGEAFEGGSAEDYPLVLGSKSFIPGFEEQLIDAKEGDEVEVKVTFPENYGAANLAGKDAVFTCTVKSVNAPEPAEIDDELAKKFGAEDLAALKGQISEQLAREYANAARAVLKRQIMDQLDDLVSFDLPPSLVEAEAGQIAHQLWHEENPEVHDHNHDAVETTDEHKKLAERRVRLGLLLAEVGNKNSVQVSEQELQQAMFQQASQYPGQERQFFEFMQKNPQAQQQLRAPIFEEKVIDYILELATVTEKSVTKAELEAAIESLDTE
ncbi:MAG TPA: trigger factor [Paracoccaceae bacterium]|nr:trigger factor [Paracoccaceae bacterium]